MSPKLNVLSSKIFKTKSLKKEDAIKEWLLVDATNETLGRFSSKVAKILRGKHKPSFTPHVDCGDYVVVINAEKIKLTGKKFENKETKKNDFIEGEFEDIEDDNDRKI